MENNTTYYERYYVGVRFETGGKQYYFATDFEDLSPGDLVVAETVNGESVGIVQSRLYRIEDYHGGLALRPIVRKPNKEDLSEYAENIKKSKLALKIAEREIGRLNLPMRLYDANYSLDGDRCTITFFAENRVDFRELLKALAYALHCRIELRQIPPRNKAALIGGIGICGLPLCCSTFLKEFDSISISKAKNQMLTINVPKLSGPCTKLICCLGFEDAAYTDAKRLFPKIGSILHLVEGDYAVTSYNVLSREVRVAKDADIKNLTLEEYNAYASGKVPPKRADKAAELPELTSSSLALPESEFAKSIPLEQNRQGNRENDRGNGRKHRNNQNRNNRNSPQKAAGQGQNGQNSQNRNGNFRRHRHRNRNAKPEGGNR